MTSRFACLVFAFMVFCMLAPQVNAQEGMPAEVHTALGKMVGNWDAETVVEGQSMKSEFTVEWSRNKQALIYHGKGTISGKEGTTGSGIFLWDGFRKVVVEQGGLADGSTISATHHITSTNEWDSPTTRTTLRDGKYVHGESLRKLRWKSDDEWDLTATAEVSDGKPQPKGVTTFRRKR